MEHCTAGTPTLATRWFHVQRFGCVNKFVDPLRKQHFYSLSKEILKEGDRICNFGHGQITMKDTAGRNMLVVWKMTVEKELRIESLLPFIRDGLHGFDVLIKYLTAGASLDPFLVFYCLKEIKDMNFNQLTAYFYMAVIHFAIIKMFPENPEGWTTSIRYEKEQVDLFLAFMSPFENQTKGDNSAHWKLYAFNVIYPSIIGYAQILNGREGRMDHLTPEQIEPYERVSMVPKTVDQFYREVKAVAPENLRFHDSDRDEVHRKNITNFVANLKPLLQEPSPLMQIFTRAAACSLAEVIFTNISGTNYYLPLDLRGLLCRYL